MRLWLVVSGGVVQRLCIRFGLRRLGRYAQAASTGAAPKPERVSSGGRAVRPLDAVVPLAFSA